MSTNTTVHIDTQCACVRREISMRKRVYPRWVATQKMTQEEADRQILVMEAVLATLEGLRAEARAKTSPELF